MEKTYLNTKQRETELSRFLKKWPISEVQKMNLQNYVDIGKRNTFCYWVERETGELGSIRGIPSDKFGIYKRGKKKHPDTKLFYSDNVYSWRKKFKKTRAVAFGTIRNRIVNTIKSAQSGDLKKVEEIDLHEFFKWKIAYLYSKGKICPFFSQDLLRKVAKHLGMHNVMEATHSEMHKYISKNRPKKLSLNDFSVEMWKLYGNKKRRTIPNNDPAIDNFKIPVGNEGKRIKKNAKEHLGRERDSKFRNEYRRFTRNIVSCPACKLNSKKAYNLSDPNRFLEMHHIEPLRHRKKSAKTTINDVTLLCPNCHSAIHRIMSENDEKRIEIDDFKNRMKKKK